MSTPEPNTPAAPPPGQAAETLSEKEVADQLGLSEKDVARIRKEQLFEGEDWVLKGRAIRYLRAAKEKIKAFFTGGADEAQGAAQDAPEAPPAAQDQAPQETADVEGTVRSRPRNPRLVFCQIGEEIVKVRVRNNLCLRPGMVIALRTDGRGNYWFTGRVPRVRSRSGAKKDTP